MTPRYAAWLAVLAVRDSNIVAMAALAVGVLLWTWMLYDTLSRWFGRPIGEPLSLLGSVITCYVYVILSALH